MLSDMQRAAAEKALAEFATVLAESGMRSAVVYIDWGDDCSVMTCAPTTSPDPVVAIATALMESPRLIMRYARDVMRADPMPPPAPTRERGGAKN